MSILDLGPVAQLRAGRLPSRIAQLLVGLVLFGISIGMMVRSGLGMPPWDVLHTGVIRHVPITLGQAVIAVSAVLLLFWIPLREKPGIGTLGNAILVGLSLDATLAVLPSPDALPAQVGLLLGGVLVNGLATGCYIGAGLGRGPRDGLMTGLARRTGRSIRLVRTLLEVTVVVIGVLLGGVLGVGTVVYALAIGPLSHLTIPWFDQTHRLAPHDRRGDDIAA